MTKIKNMKKYKFPATVVKQGNKRIIIIPVKYHEEIEHLVQKDIVVEMWAFHSEDDNNNRKDNKEK